MDLKTTGILLIHLIMVQKEATATEYTNYTTLIWLSSGAGLDPMNLWQDTQSGHNNANNMTGQELMAANMDSYRNTMIDDWSNVQPDLVRVCYRNDLGATLFCMVFNSTGSASQDWFTTARMTNQGCDVDSSQFSSYESSLACAHTTTGVHKYQAASLKIANAFWFIVSTTSNALLLPATLVSDSVSCLASYQSLHPLVYSVEVIHLHREFCSSVCRENNNVYGAVHNSTCSCLDAEPSTSALNYCNHPCAGNTNETCGALSASGMPSDAVIFNYVKTDIDTSQFDTPMYGHTSVAMTTYKQIAFGDVSFLSGLDVTVGGSPSFPLAVTMEIRVIQVSCSDEEFTNAPVITKTFTVTDGGPYLVELSTTKVRCVRLNLAISDDNGNDITPGVTITPNLYIGDIFVTASYVSIEAAWALDETCECECWVYNMLHGDSPYENLTYAEIEIALYNVTEKLKRELAVNTSELSSTIRKKTSADDDRGSATAVGYALGVALLTLTFGGLFLSDLTRIFSSLNIMKENVMSRFVEESTDAVPEPTSRRYSLLESNNDK